MTVHMQCSQYLELALAFYHQVQFKGMIYIGDSSEGEHKDKVKALCEHYGSNGLNIKGFNFPAIHECVVMDIVNQQLDRKIKYCCFAGDDDFALPYGLVKCVEFLEENPNYVAAHGHRANFTYQENGKPKLTNICYGYDWDEESTAESRWHEDMRVGIAVTNYLHRKDIWKKKFAHCHEVPSRCQDYPRAVHELRRLHRRDRYGSRQDEGHGKHLRPADPC